MANDVNQQENLPEQQPDEQSLPGEGLEQDAAFEARIAQLEGLLAEKDEELAKASTRLIELEQTLSGRNSDIAALEQSRVELEDRATTLNNSLAEAVASYKAVVVKANPEVIGELVTGDSIEAINTSLSEAKALVSKVRQGVEAEISLTRVPAGAPERTSPDRSFLSPREKIQYAIGKTR